MPEDEVLYTDQTELTLGQAVALLPDGDCISVFCPVLQSPDVVHRDLVCRGLLTAKKIYAASEHDLRHGYGLLLDFTGGELKQSNRLFLIETKKDKRYKPDVVTYRIARVASTWHDDDGIVLWWRAPIVEPPYVGTPLDDDWKDDYYTHWTPILEPIILMDRHKKTKED